MSGILACQDPFRVDFVKIDQGIWSQNAKQANLISDDAFVYEMSPSNNTSLTDREPKSRFSHIEEGLESSLSYEAQVTINRIVNEVKSLSDVEKLFLYLKLPNGDSGKDLRSTPPVVSQKPNKTQQAQTYTWIKSHLEEDELICLPKQDVYDDYKLYCDTHDIKSLSTADFGKLMKSVFPNVKPRRLGQRGQSRYCYGGLRKKLDVNPPTLPELEITSNVPPASEDDEIHTASCQLVCEWAHKLLSTNFAGIRDLAEYLITNLCVNSKSVAAFTVIAAMEDTGLLKEQSLFFNTTGGDRHRETQMLLQRKLHEVKQLREQKKKLQQQKDENEQKLLKESQDRQTPFITSPSIQSVLKSPVKRLFEDCGGRTNIVQGKGELLRSQSVMVDKQTKEKHSRSKSISDVDVEMVSVDKGGADLKKGEQLKINQPRTDTTVFVEYCGNSGVITVQKQATCVQDIKDLNENLGSLKSIEQNESRSVINKTQSESRPRNTLQSESTISDEVDGNRPVKEYVVTMETDTNKSSNLSPHVIRKPSLVSVNDWKRPGEPESSKFIVKTTSSESETTNNSVKNRTNADNDSSTLINSSNHSSRSAFVPFSQIQSRKDINNSETCKSPSISMTQTDGQIYITVPNNYDITKLPSHYLEKIEQIVGPSQLVKVDETNVSESQGKSNQDINIPECNVDTGSSRIAFQPVLQSGIIAPSSMVSTAPVTSALATSSTSLQESTDKGDNPIMSQQIVTADGKIILPANINIGGSTGIIVGQGGLAELPKGILPGQGLTSLPTNILITSDSGTTPGLSTQISQSPRLVLQTQPTTGSQVKRSPSLVLQTQAAGFQVPLSSTAVNQSPIAQLTQTGTLNNQPQRLILPASTSVQTFTLQTSAQAVTGNIKRTLDSSTISSILKSTLGASQIGSLSTAQGPNLITAMPSTPPKAPSIVPASPVLKINAPTSSASSVLLSPNGTSVAISTMVNSLPTTLCSVSTASQDISENQPSSNPSTPKKSTKSRFAPIRPKASPVKTSTISSILKDTKINPQENTFVFDKSKSVSELLKEKRAREAELQMKNKKNVTGTSNISNQAPEANPLMCSPKTQINPNGSFIIPAERDTSMKNLFTVGIPQKAQADTFIANSDMIQKLQSGQVIPPGMVPIGKSGDVVYVINPIQHLVNNSPTKPAATRPDTLNFEKDQEKEKLEKSENPRGVESPDLNDSDTMDIEDVLKMYQEKGDNLEVHCETPSKLAKMEDRDQVVHSRPGSRCSGDIETPGGRKRKFVNNEESPFRCFGRKRLDSADENDEDVFPINQIEESFNRKESRSCTFETETNKSLKSSVPVSTTSKHYPDISMLEIDALIDFVQPEQPRSVLPQKKVSSAAVGVNSLSLRKSQQKLLKEKHLLDESVRSFLQKMDKSENNAAKIPQTNEIRQGTSRPTVGEIINHLKGSTRGQNEANFGHISVQGDINGLLQSSSGFEVASSAYPTPMEEESDLPKDVADFLTEVATGNISGNLESGPADFTHGQISHEGNVYPPKGVSFDTNMPQNNPFSRPNSRQEKTTEKDQMFEKPRSIEEVKFASPKRPVGRRQRTPSVERAQSQIGPNIIDRRSVRTPTFFTSPVHSTTMRRREASVDRMTNQTPFSDPGYGSIGASPVLNPTPVSYPIICDTSTTAGHNSSFMSARADSVQSVASDAAMFSPVSSAISPRFQTSTPYPLQSPCPTPSRNIMQSPIDAVGPGQSFVPIQGTNLQIDSTVTLIKPVVTLASSQTNQASATMLTKEHSKMRKDLIGIGSILPRLDQTLPRAPPSYSDSLLSQLQGNRSDKKRLQGAFNVPHQREEMMTNRNLLNQSTDQIITSPFSHKLAQLSNKYGVHTNRTEQEMHNRSLPEHLLQSNDPHSFDEQEKSFHIESIKANLQNSAMHATTLLSGINNQDQSSQVQRSSSVLQDHMTNKMVDDDIQFMAKRNLSVDLENNTSLNEEDLETTLEDLKSLDGQYFTQDNMFEYQRL